MARFSPGDLVYVDYGEHPQLIHERLVLSHVDGLDFIIASPDRDIYCETLDVSNPDYVGFHVPPAGGPFLLQLLEFLSMVLVGLLRVTIDSYSVTGEQRQQLNVGVAVWGLLWQMLIRGVTTINGC